MPGLNGSPWSFLLPWSGWISACALALSPLHASEVASRALSPEEAARSLVLADPELKVELVAAEPLVASPCAFAWDARGRLIVAENRGYPATSQPAAGIIALLEDTDRDGRMDRRTEFATGLTFPNGVLPWQDGVIVTCAPDVLFLRDTNGDGVADEKRVLLTGFEITGSTQLRVNAPTLGPDGWIYLASGLSGGSITSPQHPERAPLKMTSDVRFHPETLVVENVDGRSQYGQSFDEYGRRFICMNRVPVQQVVASSQWWRRNAKLAFSDTVQDANERSVKTGLRGGGDGVRLFPLSANVTTADSHAGSFSAACGIHIWQGTGLPRRYWGNAFSCDPTGNLVHVDRLVRRGAAFGAESVFAKAEFLASRDDWFRPVFLAQGPEGALYVADMYRRVIEHPDYLPEEVRKRTDFEAGKDRGRIWRIRAESPIKLPSGLKPGDLLTAAREGKLDAQLLQEASNQTNPEMRELALRLWLEYPSARSWKPDPAVLGHDDDPGVRFMGALVLGELGEGMPALADLAASDARDIQPQTPLDKWTRAAVLSSIGGREEEFLRNYLPQIQNTTPAVLEILTALGGHFRDFSALQQAIPENLPISIARDKIGLVLSALALGVVERHPQTLAPGSNESLNALLKGLPSAALDRIRPPEERLIYLRLLGHLEWSAAFSALLKQVELGEPEELTAVAIRSLTRFSEPGVVPALLGHGAWNRYSPALREVVLGALLGRSEHHAALLQAMEAGQLPPSAVSQVWRTKLLRSPDQGIRTRAEKLWQAPAAERQQALATAKEALALPAVAERGKIVFKTLCSTCHRLDREGFALGPDLLDMRNQPKESILFHLVAPEAEVNVAYAPYLAETTDGRTVAGILASETPTSVTFRLPLGVEQTLLRSEIKKLEAMPGSLMPAGLEQAMSRQELADLLAYLKGE